MVRFQTLCSKTKSVWFWRHHRSYKVDKLVLALQFKRLFWCIVTLKAHTTKMFICNLHIQYKALGKYFPLRVMQSVTLQFSVKFKLHLKLKQWSPMTYHQDSSAWGRSSSNKFGLLGEFHQREFPELCAVFDCTVAAHVWLSASNSLAEVLEEMAQWLCLSFASQILPGKKKLPYVDVYIRIWECKPMKFN